MRKVRIAPVLQKKGFELLLTSKVCKLKVIEFQVKMYLYCIFDMFWNSGFQPGVFFQLGGRRRNKPSAGNSTRGPLPPPTHEHLLTVCPSRFSKLNILKRRISYNAVQRRALEGGGALHVKSF